MCNKTYKLHGWADRTCKWVNNKIFRTRTLKWYGHVKRMEVDKQQKKNKWIQIGQKEKEDRPQNGRHITANYGR